MVTIFHYKSHYSLIYVEGKKLLLSLLHKQLSFPRGVVSINLPRVISPRGVMMYLYAGAGTGKCYFKTEKIYYLTKRVIRIT